MSEPLSLEDGLAVMEKGIKKLKNILEFPNEPPFESEDYMMLYTTVYRLCTQGNHDYCLQLYEMYTKSFQEYIVSTILPSLMEKRDEYMLIELLRRWKKYKQVKIFWMIRFFHHLDREYVNRNSLPTLHEVGIYCFRDLVYREIHGIIKDAVLAMIHAEREGGQIDRVLLKNVLGIFIEIGMGDMDLYETDFEAYFLEDSASYYYRKGLNWIAEGSCPDSLLKKEFLENEKERVSHYLHDSSVEKLIERVQNQLLLVYALHLAYLYNAQNTVSKGSELVGNLNLHIANEGTKQKRLQLSRTKQTFCLWVMAFCFVCLFFGKLQYDY